MKETGFFQSDFFEIFFFEKLFILTPQKGKYEKYKGRVKKFYYGCGKGKSLRTRRDDDEENFDDEILFQELQDKLDEITAKNVNTLFF